MPIVQMPDGQLVELPEKMSASEVNRLRMVMARSKPKEDAPLANVAARGATSGLASTLGLPVDALAGAMRGVGLPVSQKPFLGSEYLKEKAGQIGIGSTNPNPNDYASRLAFKGSEIMGASVAPGARLIPSATAATGGSIAAETLGDEYAIAGMLAPTAIGAAAKKAVGATPQQIAERQQRMATAKEVGADLTASQVSQNRMLSGMENLVGKFPGGDTVMMKARETQQAKLAEPVTTGTSAEAAGKAIEDGIKRGGGFLDRTASTYKKLDNQLAAKIPVGTPIEVTNTNKVLADLTKETAGTSSLINPKIKALNDELAAYQKSGGKISYHDLKALRTRIGSMLDDSLISDVPKAELKKVYASMSNDMREAAKAAGAEKEFKRMNNYWSARQDRVETVLDRVIGKNKLPEDVFKTFMPKNYNEATKVRAVMRSLEPGEREIVSQAVVNSMGRAASGKQDELGSVFSSETFLTNWDKLSSGAKSQLFPDANQRKKMDSVASLAANIREGSGAMSNPSGTAGAFASYSIYSAPVAAVASGSFAPLIAAGGAMASANGAARLFTNKKFVNWLAASPKVQKSQLPAHLARLELLMKNEPEETKQAVSDYIQAARTQ